MNIIKKLTIEVEGQDIDDLKSAIKKIVTEFKKVGLQNNNITTDEMDVIKKLSDSL